MSMHDGEVHYISAMALAELYGVRLEYCRIIHEDDKIKNLGFHFKPDDIHLYPREDGCYLRKKWENHY